MRYLLAGALALVLPACQAAPAAAPVAPAPAAATTSASFRLNLGRSLQAYKRYTRADIDHVTLRVMRVEGAAEVQQGAVTILPGRLADVVTLDGLTRDASYVVRADAYDAAGDERAHRISVPGASSQSFQATGATPLFTMPLKLVPYTPTLGQAEAAFIDDGTAPRAVATDPYAFYWLDRAGAVHRLPWGADPLDAEVMSGPTPFEDMAIGPNGYLYATSEAGGIWLVAFMDGDVYPIASDLPATRLLGSPDATRLYAIVDGATVRVDFDADDYYAEAYATAPASLGGVAAPAGLAGDLDGALYVLDGTDGRIVKAAADGTGGTVVATVPGARDLVMGNDGDLLVSAGARHALFRVTPGGTPAILAGADGQADHVAGLGPAARFDDPEALCLGADGVLYVLDAGNAVVRRVF